MFHYLSLLSVCCCFSHAENDSLASTMEVRHKTQAALNVDSFVADIPGRANGGRGPADTQSGKPVGDFPAEQPTTALASNLSTDDVKHPVTADQSWPLLRHALAWV